MSDKFEKAGLALLIGAITWSAVGPWVKQEIQSCLELANQELERQQRLEREQLVLEIMRAALAECLNAPPPPPPAAGTELQLATIEEPDAKWREVILLTAVILILGKRGSGKSALAYRLLELFRWHKTPYVVGVPAAAKKHLPDWIGICDSLEELPNDSIALVDEAYLSYHSRGSSAEASKLMSQDLNLSRQRNQILIFVTQEARQVDRNIASSASVVVFKDLGMLQTEFDRPELRKLATDAEEALAGKKKDKKQWSYVYSPDADFLGLLSNQLPTFWKSSLSRLFAVEPSQAAHDRPAVKITREDRIKVAIDLRQKGFSLKAIGVRIGVSKSTVVNYLKGYPYKPK